MATLDQKIARKEDELNRLKAQKKKQDTAQKVVIGGMYLAIAKKTPQRARELLADIEKEVTRKADLERLTDLIEDLKKIAYPANNSNHTE